MKKIKRLVRYVLYKLGIVHSCYWNGWHIWDY